MQVGRNGKGELRVERGCTAGHYPCEIMIPDPADSGHLQQVEGTSFCLREMDHPGLHLDYVGHYFEEEPDDLDRDSTHGPAAA